MRDFTSGQQPCQNYDPEMTVSGDAIFANVHECFCGHSKGLNCEKLVSFCRNCGKDHHEDGYNNCVCKGAGFIR